MTQCPPISPKCASVTVRSQTKSMQIPIQLIVPLHSMKVINTWALVDSGTDISCIDQHFVQKNNLPTMKLSIPIWARNANHSNNKSGDIRYTCDLFVNIQGLAQKVTLYVMTCGKENIILGLPWLKKANPTVDWTMQTLTFDESIDESQELYWHHAADMAQHQSHYRPTPWLPKHINVDMIKEDHLGSYLNQETKSQYIHWALDNHAIHRIIQCGSRFLPSNSPVIARLTTATKLAIATEKAKAKPSLPPKYAPFASIFLKEATDHILPFCLYDHEINLDESFKPKIGKVYFLSPEEWKATEDFLDENLKTSKIHPSNSPQASPFFFVKKKDRGLWPCQDYRYVNEHTVRDAYPLPLISNLIDKLQGAKIFTKFDVRWGYNNVQIKDGHQWKAAFVTHKGLFEPTMMFFSLTNFPATSQHFMNDSFRDMIIEGWLVIYMVNLLIYSPDMTTHTEWTKWVLQRMVELDLHLKLEKCTFAASMVYWCIQICIRYYPSPNWLKWRMAPLFLPLSVLLSSRMELWYLWLRTPGSHPCPQNLETLPPRFPLPHPSFHWS